MSTVGHRSDTPLHGRPGDWPLTSAAVPPKNGATATERPYVLT
ncbi:hypothetical protein ACFXKE_24245 [Streptomyces sp. NPDC059202]